MIDKNRAYELMERYNIDALVASSPENVIYTSGFESLGQKVIRGTQVYVVLPRRKEIEPSVISSIGEADLIADRPSWITDLRFYGTFYYELARELPTNTDRRLNQLLKIESEEEAVRALIKALRDKELGDKKLGIDESGISYTILERIRSELSGAEIMAGNDFFRELRMIKNVREIELLEKSASITEKALEATTDVIKEDVTEKDLVRVFESYLVKNGAYPLFTVIGCGSRSALPNVNASDYKLKKGDLIRFDVGCVYKHYCSDMARIFALGEVSDRKKKYYNAVLVGEQEAINQIKPGIKACDIFKVAVESVRKAGLSHFQRHHCGHGIGIECYDPPLIGPKDDTPLQEGMVLDIETPYYELGFGGLQAEDMIVVTKDGFRYLTSSSRDLGILS